MHFTEMHSSDVKNYPLKYNANNLSLLKLEIEQLQVIETELNEVIYFWQM